MAYNTNNPVGSTDPRDLYDNAGNLDKFVNGDAPFYPDRLGQQRKSWSGIEADAENAFQGWGEQFQAFLLASGYEAPVSYAAGVTLERVTQTFVRDNIQYRIKDLILLPYTLTGNWASESGNFVSMGDSSLRQDLMLGESQIVSPGAVSYSSNGSTASLKVSLDAIFKNGLHPSMFGFAPGDDIAPLLNSVQYPFDLRGDSYTLSTGVTRTASLLNGSLSYGGGLPATFNNAIVAFSAVTNLDARRLYVVYTGSTPKVRGISVYGGSHKANLRGAYAEGTTGQGIRVQGSNDVDLTGAGSINCMRDASGSSDLDNSYGAIAVFGGTEISNRAKLDNLYIRTVGTGLSLMYGSGHSIEGCDIVCTDRGASPALAMGIYVGGLVTNVNIVGNKVSNFPLEGIDVHNTGGSATAGIGAINITRNHVTSCSYAAISVVSVDTLRIRNVTVGFNVVENDPSGQTYGFSGGILIEGVESVTVIGNKCYSPGQTPTASSYGLRISKCQFIRAESNYYKGAWDAYEFYEDWENLGVVGTYGDLIPAGKTGILLSQVRASAACQLSGVRLVGADLTAPVVRQGSSALTLFTITGCYLNGLINISNISSGLVSNNLFRNFTGTLTLTGTALARDNPGWLDIVSASASPVAGTIKAWEPVRQAGTTYYRALYQPTTM